MSQRHRVWRSVGVAMVVAWMALVAAGCGGASGGEGSSAATTEEPSATEPPTTTTTLDAQAQALADAEAAYLAYEEASNVAAADPVNPQLPELQALITGDHRIHSNSELGGFLADGEAVRFAEPSRYSVDVMSATTQSDGTILLLVCRVDDRVTYEVATGEAIDDDVVTKTIEVVMVNEGGAWKVSRSSKVADVQGVATCTG